MPAKVAQTKAKATAKNAKKAAPKKPLTVTEWKTEHSHLFPAQAKNLGIGGDRIPHRDVTRFVKFPLYVRIQRQRAILKQRIKVPAPVHQFTRSLKKDQATALFQLLGKYRPETPKQKKHRLKTIAAAQAANKEVKDAGKPKVLKYGLNHVTSLIEKKRAKLVVIAHDVNPIELVVWVPALCRKMGIPYVIVHNKSRLGYLVHKKQTAVVAVTDVNAEDLPKLQNIADAALVQFNHSAERKTGGLILSAKTIHKIKRKEKSLRNKIKA